jgi:hypothetical protein
VNKVILPVLVTIIILSLGAQNAFAAPFVSGDVFVGAGNGMIKVFDQTGALKQTLDTTSGSNEQTGMCFSSTNMYATDFTAGQATKFDFNGVVVTHPWAGPFSIRPESCVVDAVGNIYTGEVDGASDIRKWDSLGNPLATFNPTVGPRGVDWIDLRQDQCTMRYTSEGSTIHQFDVCTNTQLPNFATGLPAPCFAHRELTNGDHIVSCRSASLLLDSSGVIQQTYPANTLTPSPTFLFAMNLDPDGTSFWTADINTGDVYKINIASGNQLVHFNSAPFTSAAGLAVFGEITVAALPVGGEIIPINTTALLLAGVQSVSMWMIPVVIAGAGIGVFVIKKRN